MAEIYLATVEKTTPQQQVAIKVIHQHNASDPDFVRMLVDEARLAVQLKHPNIVTTYDLGRQDEQYYIVMELVEGEPLSRRFGRAGTPQPELLALLDQALTILEYLHGRHPPVIHRDIKPSNLIHRPLRPDSPLALIDFGGVRVALATEAVGS